ncbi:MAG: thioesterase domain-containing protein, partial [Psychrosphaera sp.]|nr:thioesterase domain-containing protein [Psychrosphaera sp.]
RLANYRAINAYGPTEATINASYSVINAEQSVNIGRAVHNAQLYVLDSHQQLAIDGAVGELYIGGAGLARGYLNRPELNAFIDYSGVRLYRTGDLVRWVDECLVFVARIDEQVNLFGLRIETGEIEYHLNQLSGVKSCVVMACENQLVAYVESTDVTPLRNSLEQLLPRYMVPAVFVAVAQWPLPATGKIDKKALPAPGSMGFSEVTAPQTKAQKQIAQIWADVLSVGLQTLGLESNFFGCGGHSLLATRLIGQINQHCGSTLKVNHLFRWQTIGELADHLFEGKEIGANLIELASGDAGKIPLFLVHPVGGYAHCYTELAQELEFDGAVFGLQCGDDLNVEKMATRYIKAIKQVQPQGPYLLGGWSMGGAIAFEMACQLGEEEQHVEHLLLIYSF